MKTTVVNVCVDAYDVFIARPSAWGNPFRIGKDGTREVVIAKYQDYLASRPDLMAMLPTLRGKRLGCHCSPLPCHGDVLARLADEFDKSPCEIGGWG